MGKRHQVIREALTFDDVSVLPAASDVLPGEVELHTQLTDTIALPVPLLSAAMDTVTEASMAGALAKLGGLGIIHKNLSPEAQAAEVARVKKTRLSAQAKKMAATDSKGRLLAGAAVGVGEGCKERLKALVTAGVDIVCIDTAHGHSQGVVEAVAETRREFPGLPIIAGNVVTAEAVVALAMAGANVIKVGVGPGSICTTRIVAGVGVPQLTAIIDCANAARSVGVRIIADGGIRYSGDIVKALSAGAQVVMLGSLLAGTDESPGELFTLEDGTKRKTYRGMGSLGAMERGSKDRYFQGNVKETKKLVPEGVEGSVAYKGSTAEVVHYLLGGLRSGMGYAGCRTIAELAEKVEFVRLTAAGSRESHVHDITIMKQSPNY